MLVEPGYVESMLANLSQEQMIVLSIFGCVALICMIVAFVFLTWYCCCCRDDKDDRKRRHRPRKQEKQPENDNDDEDDDDDEVVDVEREFVDVERDMGKVTYYRQPSGQRERPRKKKGRTPWFGSYNAAVKADKQGVSYGRMREELMRKHGTRDAFEVANGDRAVTREHLDHMAQYENKYNNNNRNYNNNNNNRIKNNNNKERNDKDDESEDDPRSPRHRQEVSTA